MTEGFLYNTIYLIESLDSSEEKSGTRLHDVIKNFEFKYPGVKTYFKEPNTKSEFLEVLCVICKFVKDYNHIPIIHLEAHGNKDGIRCSNNEFITWNELYPYFIEINIKLKNSLIVTTSICFGTHFYFNVDFKKPAPFFTLISSVGKINYGIILESYDKFYNELLYTENLNNALKLIKQEFLRPTDNELLLEAFISYMFDDFIKFISDVPALVNFSIIKGNMKISKKMKEHILNNAYLYKLEELIKVLNNLWITFLMIDLYPDIKYRYKNTKDFFIENINSKIPDSQIRTLLVKEVLKQLE